MEWQATLYVTFVDFEKAFDSVNILDKILSIIQILYEDISECALWDEGEESAWFTVKTGGKQGYVLAGYNFLLVVDRIMRKTTEANNTRMRWKFMSKREDSDYASDIALTLSSYRHMQAEATHMNMFVA